MTPSPRSLCPAVATPWLGATAPLLLGAAAPPEAHNSVLQVVLVIAAALIVLLSLHGCHRLSLLVLLWRHRAVLPAVAAEPDDALPHVTVQLPIFNERDVAARVIAAASALDWPADRIELQVLDDSTDDTRAVVDAAVARCRVPVTVLRRANRTGFKAGALAAALPQARGTLIAIFDADFVPPTGCLRALCAPFTDPDVGMVQGRWGHLNAEASWLTRGQALLLDAHFLVEHTARARSGRFFNFNGTAGVWRRAAIEGAGGWSAATLTEDLDLSYRAQLAGWRFVYLPQVVVPAELPDDVDAFVGQQARWAAGTVQVAARLLPRVLRARIPFEIKAEAAAHLLAPLAWPLSAALTVTLGPLAVVRAVLDAGPGWLDGLAFALSTITLGLFYGVAAVAEGGARRLWRLPLAMALGVGLSLRQAVAVLGAGSEAARTFVRTPKSGAHGDRAGQASYRRAPNLRWPEALVAAANIGCAGILINMGRVSSVPFLLVFAAGTALIAGLGARRRP